MLILKYKNGALDVVRSKRHAEIMLNSMRGFKQASLFEICPKQKKAFIVERYTERSMETSQMNTLRIIKGYKKKT